jgi:hypothetical protein
LSWQNIELFNVTTGVMCNYFCSLNGYRFEIDVRAPCSSGNFSGTMVRQMAETEAVTGLPQGYIYAMVCV